MMFDGGQAVDYYHERKGEPLRDRAIDSDLVKRNRRTNAREPRTTGINALERSANNYRSR